MHTLSSVAHTSNKGIKTCLKWSLAWGKKNKWKILNLSFIKVVVVENGWWSLARSGRIWRFDCIFYFFNLFAKAWTHYFYLQLDRQIFLHSIIKYSHTHLVMAAGSSCLLNEVLCLQKPSRWFPFHFAQKPHFFHCDLDPFFPGEEEWNLK